MINPLVDCLSNNAAFMRESGRGRVSVVCRAEDSPALRAVLDDLEGALARAVIKKDSRSTKAGTLALAGAREIFIKRYNNKGLRYTLRYLFRHARPFRAWVAAWACAQHGIPIPQPCAIVAQRRGGVLRQAWLICAAVPEVVPTLAYTEQVLRQPRRREHFTSQICELLARMHAAGVRHGDPKLSNIYARIEQGQFHYGLWDFDGATVSAEPLANAGRIADLARTVASLVDLAARLNRPQRPEALGVSFIAAYAAAAGRELEEGAVLKAVWHHLRK